MDFSINSESKSKLRRRINLPNMLGLSLAKLSHSCAKLIKNFDLSMCSSKLIKDNNKLGLSLAKLSSVKVELSIAVSGKNILIST